MRLLDAAHRVLREAGEPLHYREITRRVLEEGLADSGSKAPEAIVGKQLARSVRQAEKGAASSPFYRAGRGIYALVEWKERAAALASDLSYGEAALRVLQEAGRPLHYREITRRVIEQQLITPRGATPEATMRSQLYTDVKRRGSESPFRREGRGVFGLAEWKPVVPTERARLLGIAGQLRQRVLELETVHSIGQSAASESDVDEVLARMVEAAVNVTGAEEGYLLLLDEGRGELYLRTSCNLREKHAQGFRLRVDDSIAGGVVRTGEPVMFSNRPARIKAGYTVKSLLNVPLSIRGRAVGVLGVNNVRSDRAFSERNCYMLSILADYAAVAIDNAQQSARAEKLQAIQEASASIASSLELSEVLNRTCRAVVELFGVDHSGLVLFDEDLEAGTVAAEYPAQLGTVGIRIPVSGVPAEDRLAFHGEPLVFPHTEKAGSELGSVLDTLRRFDIRSVVLVPIAYEGRVLGSLSLDAVGRARQFTADEVDLCGVLAAHVAVAVEKARLFSQLRDDKERMDDLIASSFDAVVAVDRDMRITAFSRGAEEMLGWKSPEVTGRSVGVLHADLTRARETYRALDRERMIRDREVVLRHKNGTRIPALLSLSLLLDSQGEPIGQAAFLRDPRQLKSLEDRFRALIRASQAITSTLELPQVLDRVVASAVAVFPAAQKGLIYLYDEDLQLLCARASQGYPPEVALALTLQAGEALAGWVYEHETPALVGSVQEDERARVLARKIKHPEVEGLKSEICVPLLVGRDVIGVLSLGNATASDAFDAKDLELLSIFAGQAAIAIFNADLVTKKSERLSKLQTLSAAGDETMAVEAETSLPAAVVLLADNDPEFLHVRKEFLEAEGYQVIATANPAEAQRLMETEQLDLAVLDLRLEDDGAETDISGLILAKRVATTLPKIILTGFSSDEYVSEVLRPALRDLPVCVDFVSKAEGLDRFLTAVQRASSLAGGGPGPPAPAATGAETARPRKGRSRRAGAWTLAAAFASLLMGAGTGVGAIVTNDPRWLWGTLVCTLGIAGFAVWLFAQSRES